MSNTAFPLNDLVDVQIRSVVQTDVGQREVWTTKYSNIYAGVAPLYDNVNAQAWGNVHSHNIFRVIFRFETARIIGASFAAFRDLQFIWKNICGFNRILRPIEGLEFPGRTPKRWGYIRCEDITDYATIPDATQ